MKNNIKRIKIQPKYISRTWDQIRVPEIRMCGKWLKEIGFDYNRHIIVECKKNKIIITLDKRL
jgi:toxic protein SymE